MYALAVCAAAATLWGALGWAPAADDPTPVAREIDFNRDIRPILSNNCFQCHGPDGEARKAGLRLDLRGPATAELEPGRAAIVPGDPGRSLLWGRITSADPDEVMPPPESEKSLTPEQIETLRLWIESGAEYKGHWSFEPVARVAPPEVARRDWPRNEIDRFVLARLESEGLEPSPPAPREALLRRVTFDLTGLPPTPAELDAFLADSSPDAYERVVDRLLASERYGEHMARHWLDLARYGDTHGLHLDNARQMWPWRDWVIEAFNANMPYDRFGIEQLAGDLLEGATRDQIIATGFNRNHVSTSEGGAIAQEFQVKNVADRVETTATVWLGLTYNCARCHDHKFDPITQREYYELFAFFNNTTENPLDGNRADWAPIVRTPSDEQQARLDSMAERIGAIHAEIDAPDPETDAAQEAWRARAAHAWGTGWATLRPDRAVSTGGASLRLLEDGSVLAEGDNPAQDVYELVATTRTTGLRAIRLEALTDEALPFNGPGRAHNANFVLSEIEAEAVSIADPGRSETIRFVSAAADHEQSDGPFPVAAAIDGVVDATNGWAVEGYERREPRTAVFVAAEPFGFEGGTEIRVRLRFETHFASHAIGRVRLAATGPGDAFGAVAPVGLGEWSAIGPFVAGDRTAAFNDAAGPETSAGAIDLGAEFGGLTWTAHPEWPDGALHMLTGENCATYLTRTIHAPTARSLDLLLGSDDAIKVWLNGRLVHENNVARALAADQDRVTVDLEPGKNTLLLKVVNFSGGYGFAFRAEGDSAGREYLRMVAAITADPPTEAQSLALRRYFRQNHSPRMRELQEELAALEADRAALEGSLPFTLVMEERAERRPTHVLHRGEYDQERDLVEPGTPRALPPMGEDLPRNRLGLAEWLFDPANPLTARVTVNRLWHQVFGVGIVKSVEDFGSQGQWPSHPELLDHLASDFVESGWDVKRFMRRLVTSATYMQDAAAPAGLRRLDPENRLLARGPRRRLDAEEIRDQALFASGLLVETVGGAGVKPFQPDGLWRAVAYPDSDTRIFRMDAGEAIHRRTLYTYWKRTSHPPNLATFDAPNRETCVVRRPRTTTPLQSLVLFNDPQFVEAARGAAERVLRAEGETDARLRLLFRLLTSRTPDPEELAVLRDLYSAELAHYTGAPEAAAALLSVGWHERDPSTDAAAQAAMTNVASAIMSLDESITKG